MSWYGVLAMRALNVSLGSFVPAVAALNQNRPPRPDLAISFLNIIMIELIVDSSAQYFPCSFGVLKRPLIRLESQKRTPVIYSEFYSQALTPHCLLSPVLVPTF